MRAPRRQQIGRLVGGLAAMASAIPGVASASPAILYIPNEIVTLRPYNTGSCGSTPDSALGCANVEEQTQVPPFADSASLTTAIRAALAAYNVLVTNTRPPQYISYVMLMADDTPYETSQSFTCTGAGINCAARQRNDIAFTYGTTMNCMDPEVTHAALHAFGRVSGLEGVVNPGDYMNYIPVYTTPPMGFMDVCSDRINQQGFNAAGDQVELPLECTSGDHAECPDGMNGEPQQNSHQDLLLFYGERTEDTEAPVLMNILPADGTVLQEGDDLTVDVDIMDTDPAVGVRWVVSSPALEKAVEGGALSQCTNDVCNGNWADATPLKATDSDWAFTLARLPAGEYTITLEAADYHGNVAEMVTVMVTIEGGGASESSGSSSSSGSDETFGATYFPVDFTESASFTDSLGESEPGTSGCTCSASRRGQAMSASMWLLLLGGVGLRRRARSGTCRADR